MKNLDKKRSHVKFKTSVQREHENEHLENNLKALTELNKLSYSVEIFWFLYIVK